MRRSSGVIQMKATNFSVAALALMAAPAFADHVMEMTRSTCAKIAAMDSEGMMKTIEMMHTASFDAAIAMDEAAVKMARAQVMTGCEGNPDMMEMDAMISKT